MPTVSIVIPTYNSSAFIMNAVASVQRAVSGLSYEIILVDDRSPDLATLRAVTGCTPCLTIIEKAAKGNAADSRNLGIAASTGEFIFLLDSDDVFAPAHIHRRVLLHQRDACGILFGRYLARNTYRTFKVVLPSYQGDMPDYLFCLNGDVRSSTISLCRSHFKGTTFDSQQAKHQDWGFALRAAKAGETLGFDECYGAIIDSSVNGGRMSNVLNIPASSYFLSTYIDTPKHLRGFAMNHLRVVLKNNDKQSTAFVHDTLVRSLRKASWWERVKYFPAVFITGPALTLPASLAMQILAMARALTIKSFRRLPAIRREAP
jgi:glycosyltransferase involved in cell wall biosynthesis